MNFKLSIVSKLFFWSFILFFITFYPILISIYVFLPLFIGAMAYVLIQGIEKGNIAAVLIAIFYMINLEVNLSLPIFFILIVTLLFYVLIYPYFLHFRRCSVCKPLLSVVLLDFCYLGSISAFDFIFQTQSICLDSILLYSLIVDMLVAAIL